MNLRRHTKNKKFYSYTTSTSNKRKNWKEWEKKKSKKTDGGRKEDFFSVRFVVVHNVQNVVIFLQISLKIAQFKILAF